MLIFSASVGMSRYDALLVAGGLQVFYFLSSLIPWFIVDKAGRRRLFILGSAGMGTCMVLSAIFVGIGTTGLGYAAAVVLYLFQTFFTLVRSFVFDSRTELTSIGMAIKHVDVRNWPAEFRHIFDPC